MCLLGVEALEEGDSLRIDQTHAIRLGSKCLYPLNYLSGPTIEGGQPCDTALVNCLVTLEASWVYRCTE